MRIAEFDDDFRKIYLQEPRKVIVWGAGKQLHDNWKKILHIDLICDSNAEKIGDINGVQVVGTEKLREIHEKVYIIVSVMKQSTFYEICKQIQEIDIDAIVFHLVDNVAWTHNFPESKIAYVPKKNVEKLRVNIVTRDNGWIFEKFACRMQQYLAEQDVEVIISSDTRDDVDINHHIPFATFNPYQNDTLMVTHVINEKILSILRKQLEVAAMGICMSKETMNALVSYGVPRSKLCYINPAHDGTFKVRKYVLGIMNRCYDGVDVRKRATALLDIVSGIKSDYFKFIIMGTGWDAIIQEMRKKGFEVEYYPEFDYNKYDELLHQIDYYIYMGFDEGSMGYLDALSVGIGTIVTPQGYHLDVDCAIDYPCRTVKQFKEAFLDLQKKREQKVAAVNEWTWDNYTKKHLEVWNYILRRKSLPELFAEQLYYEDGIHSVYLADARIYKE